MVTDFEEKMKAEHGNAVIYEDRGTIDMEGISVDVQPCDSVDHMLSQNCKNPGIYRVYGQYKQTSKGSRFQRFDRHLCSEHLTVWAKLHGTSV